MRAWRICLKRFAEAAFLGEGARLFSGRWNPAGIPMVYTATSLSLAAIEFFVHIEVNTEPEDLVSVSAELPIEERALHQQRERLLASLPQDWRRAEDPALHQIGADWIAAGRSLGMMVPSAVIDGEWNILINPTHPDAAKIKLEQPKPFHFDARMFKAGKR